MFVWTFKKNTRKQIATESHKTGTRGDVKEEKT